jgi:Flp pilus assembly secretin CpaC
MHTRKDGMLQTASLGSETATDLDKPVSTLRPQVAPYGVKPVLSNVVNLKQFKLTDDQRRMLAKNLFVATPTNEIQLLSIYENNN